MPLQVLPAGDADMYRSAVIEHKAYSPLASNAVLFPGPFPPGVLDFRAEDLRKSTKEPNTFWFKVVDTELPEGDEQTIALSKWYVHKYPARGVGRTCLGITIMNTWLTTRQKGCL